MATPSISAIIPAYNREQFVAEAIESVLSQDYAPVELIVVDDGSTDDSAGIIQSYGGQLYYLHQKNQGVAAARNLGVAHSGGDYLAFLDSDDIWSVGKLSRQMAVFSAKPATDAVFGHAVEFADDSIQENLRHTLHISPEPSPAHLMSAMLISRKMFNCVGEFSVQMNDSVDIDWYMRLQEHTANIVMLPDTLLYRRVHNTNMSISIRQQKKKVILQTLRAGILRRKQRCGD
ncbi:glycosyltransferase family 2 protein [Pseudomonadota bacterium]